MNIFFSYNILLSWFPLSQFLPGPPNLPYSHNPYLLFLCVWKINRQKIKHNLKQNNKEKAQEGDTDNRGNYFFLCKWMSFWDSCLFRNGNFCLLPMLSTGTLSPMNLCRPCACCHSFCEFTCASILLCLEDTLFSWCHSSPSVLTIFLPPHPCSHQSLGGEGWWWHPNCDWQFQILLLFAHCSHVSPCVSTAVGSSSDDEWTRLWSMSIAECL